MTEEWIREVKQRLVSAGLSRTDLAHRVGVTGGAITRLLSGDQASSALVPAVCGVVGLPVPTEIPDEITTLVRGLSDQQRDVVLALLRQLSKQPG